MKPNMDQGSKYERWFLTADSLIIIKMFKMFTETNIEQCDIRIWKVVALIVHKTTMK